jgi:DNA-binding transcriptional MerR regulator
MMRIGELAQASAVSRDTLRFYEQRGELQQRLGQQCPLNPRL